MNQHIYSISELNLAAKSLLESQFSGCWIRGEISNLSTPSSGHIYFTLKDENAQVRAALFRGRASRLNMRPQEGLEVVVLASVSLYTARGDYQLIVEHMEELGSGLLQKQFEQTRAQLEKEGLFDEHHKQPIPVLPRTIGIITSSTGAAIHDILTVLNRRFRAIPVILYPSLVQGNQAADCIVNQIEIANVRDECDVLIIARGGGSLEDLWPFNEVTVARAIFASNIPVLTGIGHEVDTTIADYVADRRAATPSAAAETAVPDMHSFLQTLTRYQQRLDNQLTVQLKQQHDRLYHLQKRLRHPSAQLKDVAQCIDHLENRLVTQTLHRLQTYQQHLGHLGRALNTVSPLATLDRGYALVHHEDHLLADCSTLKKGHRLKTRMKNGVIHSIVEKIDLLDNNHLTASLSNRTAKNRSKSSSTS